MATRFSMKVEGFKELARNLRALGPALERSIVLDVLKDAAEPMRQTMAQLAPREPGKPDLADNIGISVANRLGDVGGGRWEARHDQEHGVAVGPTKNFFYGIFQEYGTVHHAAHPFMRPAFDSNADKSLKIISDGLWRSISAETRTMSTTGRTT